MQQKQGLSLRRTALLALLCASIVPAWAITDAQRSDAAKKTVASNAACTALPKFYWEIGDRKGALASGTRGMLPPKATDAMALYSAGKWLWGAYVYQRRFNVLNAADVKLATLSAGYTQDGQCLLQTTVAACQTSIGKLDSAAVGKFSYGPGHFQKQAAIDFGLGTYTNAQLATEIVRGLGGGFALSYNQPQLAGGARSSAADYAIFLRKILNGQLMIGGLGANAVCTNTAASNAATGRAQCSTALYSPASDPLAGLNEAWRYSIGHWVEDDPATGDRAFSSAGAGGFYPWIDSTKAYYGILARLEVTPTSSAKSIRCGRLIRKAWLSGVAQ